MSDKVSKLKVLSFPKKSEEVEDDMALKPIPEVIEILERWLALAKEGEIRALAVVGVDSTQDISTESFNEGDDFYALCHGTRVLDHRVNHDIGESFEE